MNRVSYPKDTNAVNNNEVIKGNHIRYKERHKIFPLLGVDIFIDQIIHSKIRLNYKKIIEVGNLMKVVQVFLNIARVNDIENVLNKRVKDDQVCRIIRLKMV